MATRQVLAELAAAYEKHTGTAVAIESVGGVDAAKRVQAGEPFDIVILASDAVDKLIASGAALAGSKIDLVRSPVAVAVRAGAAQPDISSEAALRAAVERASSIGYSTGPSGTALLKLLERWGLAASMKDRIVQAPPGVPVGTLVARGEVGLGFQQLSELIHLPGLTVLGVLPKPIEIITIFSGAICAPCTGRDAARRLLEFMASPEAAEAKRRQGMQPA